DGVRDRYGWLPKGSFTEDQADSLLFPSIASAADPATGELLYLTRTGRRGEYGSEKTIIRVDRELQYVRSYLLDVNAARMIYLAGPRLVILATTNDEIFR